MNNKPIEKKDVPAIVKSKEELLPSLIDPTLQVEFATKAAKALTAIVASKSKKVMINGEQYLEFEDWQTIARFYNISVGVEWTKEIMREGKLAGFEAKANVYNATGAIISSAEASCLRDEKNWATRPEFMLKSMSQTRASAKALRNVLAWVVVLAGFKPTPAEEMDGVNGNRQKQELPTVQYGEFGEPLGDHQTPKEKAKENIEHLHESFREPFPSKPKTKIVNYTCGDCQAPISDKVAKYSKDKYDMELCYDCQKKYKVKR